MSDLRRATQELPALLENIKKLETAVKALAVEGVYVIGYSDWGVVLRDRPHVNVSALPPGIKPVESHDIGEHTHVYADYMGCELVCLYPAADKAAA